MGGASLVFIKDKELAWVPAIQDKVEGGKATVKVFEYADEQAIICDGGKTAKGKSEKTVNLKDYTNGVLPLQNVDGNGELVEYPDMVDLPYLHEAAIVFNLKKRHRANKPYTRTGDIILALNPFAWFKEIYTEQQRILYSNAIVWKSNPGDQDPRKALNPHVYETSSLVYKGLFIDKHDQSILVSGESGAGKTETVKICMNHIASVQRGPLEATGDDSFSDPVVNRILESNPLLESFGNAKTTRNDNSSRFGKYLQLQFHDLDPSAPTPDKSKTTCILVGSKCETYLLEKNRITGHEPTERTYHVMYQIAAAPDDEKKRIWPELLGKEETSYKYVGKSPPNTLIDGMTDEEHFINTTRVLKSIDIKDEKLDWLQQAIAAVMACGNLTFEPLDGDTDKSSLDAASKPESNKIADLLGVSHEQLALAFTERTMKTRNESYKVPLNPGVAKDSCDAFAKQIYANLFLWLVVGINKATSAEVNYEKKDTISYGIIGLLDIFGFESFVINRFEQLCINYANEKLQQKFTEDIFMSVQKEYEAEGIDLDEITYDDNSDVLELVDGRTGLMSMLNEECVRPKGNDETFVNKALGANKKSPCLIINKTDRMSFGVHHFAGKVMYSGEMFVARNMDAIPVDLEECFAASSNPIVKFKPEEKAGASKKPKRTKSNLAGSTVWNKYKVQMAALMGDLRKTRSRYIRCVKPNKAKVPSKLDHLSTVEQLRCAGVVAAVTITRSAFPNQLEMSSAIGRFKGMWNKKDFPPQTSGSMSEQEKLAAECDACFNCALKKLEADGKRGYVVGKTKVYFRAGSLEYLEQERLAALEAQCIVMQKMARMFIMRMRFLHHLEEKYREEREAKEAAERAEREKREAAERAEREKREAAERAEREKREAAEKAEREAREAREKAEREAREAAEKEERERQEKLAKEAAEREMKRQKAEAEIRAAQEEQARKRDALENEMKNQLRSVQQKIEEAKIEQEELEKATSEDAKKNILEPKKLAAACKQKIESNDKEIDYLKKEHKKMKKSHDKVKKKFDELAKNNKKLMEQNEEAGSAFGDENDGAMSVHKQNETLMEDYEQVKKNNKQLKDEVASKQKEYMATAEARLEYQKTMARILNLIQDNCKDNQLIEDTVCLALDCEKESKTVMAVLDAEYGE